MRWNLTHRWFGDYFSPFFNLGLLIDLGTDSWQVIRLGLGLVSFRFEVAVFNDWCFDVDLRCETWWGNYGVFLSREHPERLENV